MPIYPYSFTMPPVNKQDIPSDGVVGEFLGISAGGVLDWLPVAGGGGSGDMLAANNLSELTNDATARTNIGLGTTDSPEFANLTLTSPSLSSSAPVTISQTWNGTGSTVFKALIVNATTPGTTSSSSSLLLDLQVGGVSKVSADKIGGIKIGDGTANGGSTQKYLTFNTGWGEVGFANWGGELTISGGGLATVSVGSPAYFTTHIGLGGNKDTANVKLWKDADNTLALRNGTSAQTFNVYGTWTTAITNFERLAIKYNTTDLAYQIAAEKGTTNGDYRPLQLWTGGASRLHITTAGNVGIGTTDPDNALTVRSTTNNVNGVGQLILLSSDALAADKGGRFGLAGIYDNVNGRALFAEVAGLKENATSGNWAGYLTLRTRAAGGAITDRLRIDSAGNVGIGTTAPSEKLHVLGGKVLFGDPSDPTGTAGNGELTLHARTLPQLNMVSNVGVNSFFGLSLKAGAAERAGLLVNMQSGEVKMGALSGSGYFPTFWSNGVEIMRLSTTGLVGIGTTSPTSKLHVAGNSSPTITVENTLATGYSQFLFKNTAVTGDGFWLNGSAQSGYGGPSSFNLFASSGPMAFHTASVTNALSIAQNGVVTTGRIIVNTLQLAQILNSNDTKYFWEFSTGSEIATFARLQTAPIMQFAGTTNLFPALKRSSTTLQVRLANDSDFAPIQGKLTTETAFTATTVTPTGFITLYDSTGTAYKVPCVPA